MFYIQIYVAVIRYTSENSLDTHFYVYLMHNVLNPIAKKREYTHGLTTLLNNLKF